VAQRLEQDKGMEAGAAAVVTMSTNRAAPGRSNRWWFLFL
jgi:hypothetical protein